MPGPFLFNQWFDYSWQRPSLPTTPLQGSSPRGCGAVALLQAARTKEVIAIARRATGRRDMAFSVWSIGGGGKQLFVRSSLSAIVGFRAES
jgi:hypothetical protein